MTSKMQTSNISTNNAKINKSTGLCLSGGGALGFSHIGVLQSLEDHGIYPNRIAGTSMGAIIGAFYAAGYTPAQMLQLIKDDKLYKVTKLMTFRPTFLKSGLSNHHILRKLIHELIPHNSFEKLKIHFEICVVNLTNANWEIVTEGELDKWVAASASIPGVFEAIKHNDTFYVDGGLLNNLPTQGLEKHCPIIIGVNVIPHLVPVALTKPIDTLASSIRAMQHRNSQEGRSACRFLIEPKAIEKYHEFSFEAYQDIYQLGYNACNQYIAENAEIKNLCKST